MKAPKYANLRKMSKDDLIEKYDDHTKDTNVHTDFLLEEIYRRDREEHDQKLIRIRREMHCMTIAITVLTVIITILTALMTWKAST